MDRLFIKNMVESYYNDKQLSEMDFWHSRQSAIDELNEQICVEFDNLYLDDVDIYNELYEMDRSSQQKTIYNLLNQFISDKYNVDYSEESITIAGGIGAKGILASIGAGAGGVIDLVAHFIASSFIFAIVQPFIAAAIGLGLAIAVVYFWRNISSKGWDIISKLNSITDKAAKLSDNFSKKSRVKREIFTRQLEKCAKRCNIHSKKDLSRLVGSTVGQNSQITSKEAKEQVDCLSSCYLDWIINNMEILAYNYLQCLKNTNDDMINQKIDSKVLLITKPQSENCKVFYDILQDHYKKFVDTLDIVKKENERPIYMKRYLSALERATQKIK